MTAQEFATSVIPSKVLQLQEKQDILCRLVTGTGNLSQGFSTNTETRVITGPKEIVVIKSNARLGYYSFGHEVLDNNSFHFNVNKESFIYGLQLRGLRGGKSMEDKFVVNLLLDSECLASSEFEGLMSVGKPVEVNFKKPFLLKANTNYTLQVRYNNSHLIYASSQCYQIVYNTTAGVRMGVNFNNTTISQIVIAKRIQ